MSFNAVKDYFKQFNMENRLLEFPVSSATVELAAIALNCEPCKIAKTLSFHAVGGICPFAVKNDVEVYLDESLKRFTTVFPACGSSNSAIELSLEELYKYANAKAWIDVCDIKETHV